jgi:hypothetical protein
MKQSGLAIFLSRFIYSFHDSVSKNEKQIPRLKPDAPRRIESLTFCEDRNSKGRTSGGKALDLS